MADRPEAYSPKPGVDLSRKDRGDFGRFISEGRRVHKVARLERFFRLLNEALGHVVLLLQVWTETAVIDALEICRRAGKLITDRSLGHRS